MAADIVNRELTADRLQHLFRYDRDTGVFARLSQTFANRGVGEITNCGYLRIGIDNKRYLAHRLAWLYEYGEWPKKHIDHINGDKTDNRIVNLREADRSLNLQNIRRAPAHSKTGLLGASFHRRSGLWLSRIYLSGKTRSLGYFKTAGEAHAAYLTAKRQLHEGCTI